MENLEPAQVKTLQIPSTIPSLLGLPQEVKFLIFHHVCDGDPGRYLGVIVEYPDGKHELVTIRRLRNVSSNRCWTCGAKPSPECHSQHFQIPEDFRRQAQKPPDRVLGQACKRLREDHKEFRRGVLANTRELCLNQNSLFRNLVHLSAGMTKANQFLGQDRPQWNRPSTVLLEVRDLLKLGTAAINQENGKLKLTCPVTHYSESRLLLHVLSLGDIEFGMDQPHVRFTGTSLMPDTITLSKFWIHKYHDLKKKKKCSYQTSHVSRLPFAKAASRHLPVDAEIQLVDVNELSQKAKHLLLVDVK